MTSPTPPPDAFVLLGRAVADALPTVAPDRLARQRARVVALTPMLPWRLARPLAWGVAVALTLAGVWGARRVWRPSPPSPVLTVRIGTHTVSPGQWIAATEHPLPLHFSDGSEVQLAPGAHARVVSLDAQGARMLVERGRVEVSVRHASQTRWSFSAGPYTVQVTGTRFEIAWEPDGARFDLSLREGSVTLRGPRCTEGLVVRERDEVHADLVRGTLAVGPGSRDGVAGSVPQGPIAQGAAWGAPVPSGLVAQGLVAPGRSLRGAVSMARRTGRSRPRRHAGPGVAVPTQEETSLRAARGGMTEASSTTRTTAFDAAGTLAEAEAALRAQEPLRARELLLALRARAPQAPEATRAAFQLGVATLALGAPALAAGWFERYLLEAPRGPLAHEARGRRMEALRSAGDMVGARRAAEDYLLHDPAGAFAPVARAMLPP